MGMGSGGSEWDSLKDLPLAGWELGPERPSLGPARALHGAVTSSHRTGRSTQADWRAIRDKKKKMTLWFTSDSSHITCRGQRYLQFLTSVFNVKAYMSVWDVGRGCHADSESLSSSRLGLWDSVCSVKHGQI